MGQRIVELDDLHTRLGLVETQLATAKVQRVAGPASGLLFYGLAWFWFRSEILSAVPGSSRFLLVLILVVGFSLGLAINEFRSRRVIARLEVERQDLEAELLAGVAPGDVPAS